MERSSAFQSNQICARKMADVNDDDDIDELVP